jgi:Homing endonuclease associated repeat
VSCPRCGGLVLDTQIPSGAWRCKNTRCRAASPNYQWPTATTERGSAEARIDLPDAAVAVVPHDPPPATTPPRSRRLKFTRDEMLDQIRTVAAQLGRTPSQKGWRWDKADDMASRSTITTTFGSWRAAIDAAGLPQNPTGRRAGAGAAQKTGGTSQPPRAPATPSRGARADTEPEVLTAPDRAPVGRTGVVEAPPAPPAVFDRLPALRAMHLDEITVTDEPAWRDDATRRYIDLLLIFAESTDPWDDPNDVSVALFDRIERLLSHALNVTDRSSL